MINTERIFTHVQKNETKLFLNNLNYLFGNESMNTKTLRLTDSAEPQEVFTNVLSTKEKMGGKTKRKYDILNLLSQKQAKIESDSNLD